MLNGLMGAAQKAKRESVLTSQELALGGESSVFAVCGQYCHGGIWAFVGVGMV